VGYSKAAEVLILVVVLSSSLSSNRAAAPTFCRFLRIAGADDGCRRYWRRVVEAGDANGGEAEEIDDSSMHSSNLLGFLTTLAPLTALADEW